MKTGYGPIPTFRHDIQPLDYIIDHVLQSEVGLLLGKEKKHGQSSFMHFVKLTIWATKMMHMKMMNQMQRIPLI